MDAKQVRELLAPPTITVVNAGRVLGLSRNATYEAVGRGDLRSITIGKRILVLTAPLRQKLEIES